MKDSERHAASEMTAMAGGDPQRMVEALIANRGAGALARAREYASLKPKLADDGQDSWAAFWNEVVARIEKIEADA